MVLSLGPHLGSLLELCILTVLRFCCLGLVDYRVSDMLGMDLVKSSSIHCSPGAPGPDEAELRTGGEGGAGRTDGSQVAFGRNTLSMVCVPPASPHCRSKSLVK